VDAVFRDVEEAFEDEGEAVLAPGQVLGGEPVGDTLLVGPQFFEVGQDLVFAVVGPVAESRQLVFGVNHRG
jgi:hypothetical protein